MQISLLCFAPRFTRTNHAPTKRPALVPAKRGPGRPRKQPRPVDVDDRFVHTWYASMEKEIQEAINVMLPNLTATATSSFFQQAFEFQQSFKLRIRPKDLKFTSTTSVLR